MLAIRVTYYLEVLSSWCHWAEPTWKSLQQKYADVANFEWKIALMEAAAFPKSRAECDWFYQRSGMVRCSPYKLNSGWFEPDQGQFLVPSLLTLAAKKLGIADDSVRLALSHAALIEGQKIARWPVAVEVVAQASGLLTKELLVVAQSPEILAEAQASTAEFASFQLTQRPAFVITSEIGDRAIFSGLVQFSPMAATIDAMLEDVAAYTAHAAHLPNFSSPN